MPTSGEIGKDRVAAFDRRRRERGLRLDREDTTVAFHDVRDRLEIRHVPGEEPGVVVARRCGWLPATASGTRPLGAAPKRSM